MTTPTPSPNPSPWSKPNPSPWSPDDNAKPSPWSPNDACTPTPERGVASPTGGEVVPTLTLPTTPTAADVARLYAHKADARDRIARRRGYAADARASASAWRASHRWNSERLHAQRTALEWAMECEAVALAHDAAVLAARADLANVRSTLARWRAACVGFRRIARIYSHAARFNAATIGD